MSDQPSSVWGIQQLFIRPGDGKEYQIKACQEAQITAKATLAKLMGDDSLVPLDTQPKSKEIAVNFKNGQISQVVETLLIGGSNVSNAAGTLTANNQESVDTSIKTALVASLIGGQAANLISDTYTFQATGANSYTITSSKTGLIIAAETTASYPINGLIPGVTFTVSGTLVQGSTCSITTVAVGETVEIASQAKNDFAAKVAVRCITETPSETKGETAGQFEWLFPVCQSEGIEWPNKTKEFAIISGSFMPLFDPNIGVIAFLRKYSRQQ